MPIMDYGVRAPIFVLGCHKSGTSLLRALLDGHENLFALPQETHFFQYLKYPVLYGLRKPSRVTAGGEPFWSRLGPELSRISSRKVSAYSDSASFSGYDFEKIESWLYNASPESPREEFCAYLAALYASLTDKALGPSVRLVEKSVEHAEFADIIRCWFPGAQFIHIVRNPYATLSGIRRAKIKQQGNVYPHMHEIIASMATSYHYLRRNSRLLDNYLVLRYEDLIKDTETMMRRVSDFLGMRYSDTLLRPTILGREWESNSTQQTRSSKYVERSYADGWREDIMAFEIALVNKTVPQILSEYDYPLLRSTWRALLRCQAETRKVYLRNRALLVATQAI